MYFPVSLYDFVINKQFNYSSAIWSRRTVTISQNLSLCCALSEVISNYEKLVRLLVWYYANPDYIKKSPFVSSQT
jgi:hypothetical protein